MEFILSITLLNEDKIFFEKNRIERFLIEK